MLSGLVAKIFLEKMRREHKEYRSYIDLTLDYINTLEKEKEQYLLLSKKQEVELRKLK